VGLLEIADHFSNRLFLLIAGDQYRDLGLSVFGNGSILVRLSESLQNVRSYGAIGKTK